MKAGIWLAMDGLQPSSKGARVKFAGKSRTVIDGPFTEAKEVIAGFWIWKLNSLEEAIEWVKRIPADDTEIEIRQVGEMEDFAPILSEEEIQYKMAKRAELPNQTFNKYPWCEVQRRSPFHAMQRYWFLDVMVLKQRSKAKERLRNANRIETPTRTRRL